MVNPFEASKYNALDKAWKHFINYEMLHPSKKNMWDKKLEDVEGSKVDLKALQQFIEINFEEKDR